MSGNSTNPVPVSRWIWPGLLILGPAAVIVASVITAYFVLQHPDGLVASDYYKQGKAINAKLSQLDRARELGMDSLQLTVNEKSVTLKFPTGQDTGPIDVVLAHPVNPDQDIRKTVERDASGAYTVPLVMPLAERRRVTVADAPAHSWRVEALLSLPQK
ncbi:MAG: FixH family protein [Burkholderiales bacterium]|nr:FixH family protein [Burkholderiales bacterium]